MSTRFPVVGQRTRDVECPPTEIYIPPLKRKRLADPDAGARHRGKAGYALLEVRRSHAYVAWGYVRMAHYVERELGMPAAKAKRLMMVVEVFGDREADLKGIGWSVLSEALPIARATDVEAAIGLAREGREAVRQWKEKHAAKADENDPSWKWIKLRVPPDVEAAYAEAMTLAAQVALTQGVPMTDHDQPWVPFHAMVVAALEALRA